MPAPARPTPIKTYPDSARFTNGIAGVYTDLEVDALLANLPAGVGEPAITVHAGSPPVPLSGDPTPQELDDAFAVLPNGLHYYPDGGTLIAILRGEYQTTITITGPVRSVAQIVKSSAGLPTPENPSMIVTQAADGRWSKVIGPRLDQPFGDPQMVDIFTLIGGGDGGLTALTAYYTRLEVDALLAALPSGGAIDLGGYAKTEDLPIVYEQDAEPVGKDGDLWLGPEVAHVAAPVTQPVIEGQPQGKSMTEPEVKAIVRTMIAGGKEPPVDFDWTPLVSVKGTGLIEAKQTNGVLLLRGELVFTYSSAGTYTTVRTLPAKLPKPLVNCSAVVTGKENGLAFKFVSVTLTTSGDLNVVASGGKFTHVSFDGMIAYVC